jgi:membrane protein implicated in regulation of membrane protease activity
MAGWLVWLIVAVVLGVVELFTLTAALGLIGAAAAVTAVFAAIGLPLPLQFAVFAAASAAGVILIRPAVHRFMHHPPLARFGVDALIGRSAYVLREVTGRDGRIRIGGEEWSARACDEAMVIPEGEIVDVMEIRGSTAIVYPREDSWRSPSP